MSDEKINIQDKQFKISSIDTSLEFITGVEKKRSNRIDWKNIITSMDNDKRKEIDNIVMFYEEAICK